MELLDCDSVGVDIIGRCAALECWIVEVGWGVMIYFFNLAVERTQHAVSLLFGAVGL